MMAGLPKELNKVNKFAWKIQIILIFIFVIEILDMVDDQLLSFFKLSVNGIPNIIFDTTSSFFEIFLVLAAFFIGKKRIQQTLAAERRYRHIIDLSPEAIFVHSQGKIVFVNKAGEALLGAKNRNELLHYNLQELIDQDSYHSNHSIKEEFSNTDDVVLNYHIKVKRLDQSVIDIEITSIRVEYDGVLSREIIARDISVRKQKEYIMEQLAFQDTLTELPNRRAFLNKLEQLLNNPNEHRFAVMLLDLDGFKKINDTFGHEAGDILLKKVSGRLKNCVIEKDMVARLAGDEFTILLLGENPQEYIEVADRMIESLNRHFILEGVEVRITSSIGIAIYPKDAGDVLTLLKKADMAMYQAKHKGKNRYQFFAE